MNKYIKWLLLMAWMAVIFFFSSQDGVGSARFSDTLLKDIYHILPGIDLYIDLSAFLEIWGTLIRKVAHFSEYLILALLIRWCLEDLKYTRKDALAFVFAVLYAILDETHQLFVSGRSFQLTDILIDASGALCALGLRWLFQRRKKRS